MASSQTQLQEERATQLEYTLKGSGTNKLCSCKEAND